MNDIYNTDVNFNGGLYVVNKLSKKPAQCILKEKSNFLNIIGKEQFDLFIKQDYSKNVVNIITSTKSSPDFNVVKTVPVTAKLGAYSVAAKKSVEEYKVLLKNKLFEETFNKKLTLKEKIYKAIEKFLYNYGDE